jgi:hypothetical protein
MPHPLRVLSGGCTPLPRALPWAGMYRPCGATEPEAPPMGTGTKRAGGQPRPAIVPVGRRCGRAPGHQWGQAPGDNRTHGDRHQASGKEAMLRRAPARHLPVVPVRRRWGQAPGDSPIPNGDSHETGGGDRQWGRHREPGPQTPHGDRHQASGSGRETVQPRAPARHRARRARPTPLGTGTRGAGGDTGFRHRRTGLLHRPVGQE